MKDWKKPEDMEDWELIENMDSLECWKELLKRAQQFADQQEEKEK